MEAATIKRSLENSQHYISGYCRRNGRAMGELMKPDNDKKRKGGNPAWARSNHGTKGNYPSPFEGDSMRLKEDCKSYLPHDHRPLAEDPDDWDQEDWSWIVHRNDN